MTIAVKWSKGSWALPHALLSFFVLGCGGNRPPEDPASYLRVGSDPSVEAEAHALALARAGYSVDVRVDGRSFVAVGGHRLRDRASAVRILTERGTPLALDAPDARFPERIRIAIAGSHTSTDMEGREVEELVLEVRLRTRACLALVRITHDGFPVEIPLPLGDLPGGPCVERLEDAFADGRPTLIATIRLESLEMEPQPSVPVAMRAISGRYVLLPPGLARAFYAEERRTREAALREAAGDVRIRIASELALIARLEGRSEEEAMGLFDRSVEGLSPELEPSAAAARREVGEALEL